MTDNLDLLPEAVREALAICDRDVPEIAGNGYPTAWGYVRTELLRLARENAEWRRECKLRPLYLHAERPLSEIMDAVRRHGGKMTNTEILSALATAPSQPEDADNA